MYNSKVGLALVCLITNRVKGYPFEVALPEAGPVQGVVLADQLGSLYWRSREAELIAKAPLAVVERVLQLVGALLGDRPKKQCDFQTGFLSNCPQKTGGAQFGFVPQLFCTVLEGVALHFHIYC